MVSKLSFQFGALILAAGLAAGTTSFAQNALLPGPVNSNNCIVVTTSTYKDGEVEKATTAFKLKSKSECLKMQRILSENFSPREIVKVSAQVTWLGK